MAYCICVKVYGWLVCSCVAVSDWGAVDQHEEIEVLPAGLPCQP